MKTKIIIQETIASLVVEAETEFEREMLKQVERFRDHTVQISTDECWGKTTKGSLSVLFATQSPEP